MGTMKTFGITIVLLLTAACGGGGSSPTPTGPSPSPAPVPLPAPQNPAPQALQGTWTTTLKDGSNQLVTLRLGETSYGITRGSDGANGSIGVHENLIDFFRSSACNGTGTYRWTLQGNSLAFTENAVGAEPCPGRGEVLNGYIYTKRDTGSASRLLDAGHSGASHGLQLNAIVGSGAGVVNVTATAIGGAFTLNTQDSINVHGVPPNTVLYVRASADTGLPGGQQSDGICQRAALGLFGPVALFPGGPMATIQTSPGGAGTVHITDARNSPFLSDGGTTELMLRLVDALPPAVPTIDLRTDCFTLLVR